MRRGREIVGLPVIKLSTGEELGFVVDLIWNHDQRQIKSICLDSGGVFCKMEPIPLREIAVIGQDAVTVSDEAKMEKEEGMGGGGDRSLSAVAGALVMTDSGHNLGTLQDVVVDDNGQSLVGYEVSGGLVEDFISGREVLPAEAILAWGNEAVMVRSMESKIGEKEET